MALQVGTGTGVALAGSGAMNSQSTAVGNVGTGEDNLHTFDVPANSLVVTNRKLVWEGAGTLANNANAKTLKVYFGSVAVFTLAAPAGLLGVAVEWRGAGRMVRTGSSAQRYEVSIRFSVAATGAVLEYAFQGTLTQTETAAITIKATGEATSNNDIVQNLSTIRFE